MSKPKDIESRTIRVIEYDGTITYGQVNIKRGSGYDRVSELINNKDEMFLVVYKATVTEPKLEKPYKLPVTFINKLHIKKAMPDGKQ